MRDLAALVPAVALGTGSDANSHARDALPRILAYIEDQGWEATTVSGLLAGDG